MGESTEILPPLGKVFFLSNFLCSTDRYAIENRFDPNYFVTYA